jgi:hypothetical protein
MARPMSFAAEGVAALNLSFPCDLTATLQEDGRNRGAWPDMLMIGRMVFIKVFPTERPSLLLCRCRFCSVVSIYLLMVAF